MSCNIGHSWPRAPYDQRLLTSGGSREISTCNDCMATRIRFSIDQKMAAASRRR